MEQSDCLLKLKLSSKYPFGFGLLISYMVFTENNLEMNSNLRKLIIEILPKQIYQRLELITATDTVMK